MRLLISFLICLVNHCASKTQESETIEYLSNRKKNIINSSPDECCMSCYYTPDCIAWHMHKLNRICTIIYTGAVARKSNKNLISGLKPQFINQL